MRRHELGAAIRAERLRHGWSQRELAERAGVDHQQQVARIELGTAKGPALEHIIALVQLLRIDLLDLFPGEGPQHGDSFI